MADVFDLQGSVSADLSPLDDLGAEIQGRVGEVKATATIDVDTAKAEAKIKNLQTTGEDFAKSLGFGPRVDVDTSGAEAKIKSVEQAADDLRREVETPIKPDVETSSMSSNLDEVRSAWQDKWGTAIDEVGAALSKMQAGSTATQAVGGMLTGKTGALIGGGMALGGAVLTGAVIQSSVGAAMNEDLIKKSTRQVFGGAAEDYEAEAKRLADSTGYMTTELLQAQVALNKMQLSTQMKGEPIKPLTRVATDIAATTGLPQYANNIQAVTNAIASGVEGATGALLDFGIRLDDLYVLSLPVNASFRKMGEEITPAQMAQARYNAIMEQTAKISGKASETSDDASRSMQQFKQSMNTAMVDVGKSLLPIVKGVADFIGNMPPELLRAGVWGALAIGVASMLGGAVINIRALTSAVRDLGATSAVSAAEVNAAGRGRMLLGTGGGTAAGGGKYVTGKLATGGLSMAALGTYGLVAYGGYEATKAAWNYSSGQMKEQWSKADYREIRTSLLQKEILTKKTGRLVAPSAEEIADWKESYKVDSQTIDAMVTEYVNKQNARLAQSASGAGQGTTQINIVIQDRTDGGLQVIDSGGYSESNY